MARINSAGSEAFGQRGPKSSFFATGVTNEKNLRETKPRPQALGENPKEDNSNGDRN